jgi:hypothetical protein
MRAADTVRMVGVAATYYAAVFAGNEGEFSIDLGDSLYFARFTYGPAPLPALASYPLHDNWDYVYVAPDGPEFSAYLRHKGISPSQQSGSITFVEVAPDRLKGRFDFVTGIDPGDPNTPGGRVRGAFNVVPDPGFLGLPSTVPGLGGP